MRGVLLLNYDLLGVKFQVDKDDNIGITSELDTMSVSKQEFITGLAVTVEAADQFMDRVIRPLPPPQAPQEASPATNPVRIPEALEEVGYGHAAAGASEKAPGELTTPGYDETTLLHMEMSALDDVDVEHIATKIRKNAKGIVKRLHLGHLMAEKEEQG
jgi:hypothetical protein